MKVFGSKSIWSTIITALALGVSLAQQPPHLNKQAIEARLFNSPSALFKLEASSNGRGFEFCNYSSKPITKFSLGCVKKKAGELLIGEQRGYLLANLEPLKDTFQCRAWMAFHDFFPVDECRKGKLAVVEVEFADGTQWKLKP